MLSRTVDRYVIAGVRVSHDTTGRIIPEYTLDSPIRGLAAKPSLVEFLRQSSFETVGFEDAWSQLDLLRPQIGMA